MGAITDIDIRELGPNGGLKAIMVQTRNTVDAADTIAIDLQTYGIAETGFLMVFGNKHTTDGSVVATEAPETAVSSGTLTITVPAGTDNDTRCYLVFGSSEVPSYT